MTRGYLHSINRGTVQSETVVTSAGDGDISLFSAGASFFPDFKDISSL